jgi:hypothetical protein
MKLRNRNNNKRGTISTSGKAGNKLNNSQKLGNNGKKNQPKLIHLNNLYEQTSSSNDEAATEEEMSVSDDLASSENENSQRQATNDPVYSSNTTSSAYKKFPRVTHNETGKGVDISTQTGDDAQERPSGSGESWVRDLVRMSEDGKFLKKKININNKMCAYSEILQFFDHQNEFREKPKLLQFKCILCKYSGFHKLGKKFF